MLGLIDPRKKTLRLSRLLIFNVMAILALTPMLVSNLRALRTAAGIGIGLLFVADLLLVRRANRLRENAPPTASKIPRVSWFGAIAFTAAGLVTIVVWIRSPNLSSAVQVLVAIVLVSYIWFLIYRLRRNTKRQTK